MKTFKTFTGMHQHPIILKLLRKHGLEGYGMYYRLLFLIAKYLPGRSGREALGPLPEEYDIEMLASDFRLPVEKVREVLSTMAELGIIDQAAWAQGRIVNVLSFTRKYTRRRREGGAA